MTYNAKLTALHKGLTPIHADQDRINFAPKLAEDIRITLEDGSHMHFNKIYTAADTEFPDLANTVWVVSDIDGWWNLAESSVPDIPRGFGDGSFDVSGRFLPRDLTITGSVLINESSRSAIATKSAAVRTRLLNAFNLVKRSTWLIVDEDSYKRAAFVRLSGRPQISTVNSRGRIDFSIGLRAPDPVKYEWLDTIPPELIIGGASVIDGNGYQYSYINSGSLAGGYRLYNYVTFEEPATTPPAETTSYREYGYDTDTTANSYRQYSGNISLGGAGASSTTIYNYGNSDVYCLFRIVGPLYGPAVIENYSTGQTINILAAADPAIPIITDSTVYLDINTKKREVVLGSYATGSFTGSSRALLEPLVDWIYLQPGENTIYYSDDGLTSEEFFSTLQIYWRSGWIG
jgi:hypothetical protein